MSLMKTKPHWCKDAIATDRGWTNPNTGEILVAIGNLKVKLEAEMNQIFSEPTPAVTVTQEPVVEVLQALVEVVETPIEEVKEEIMEPVVEQAQKRAYNKKPKVVGEVVEETKAKIIGEVVEYDLEDNKKVIGE